MLLHYPSFAYACLFYWISTTPHFYKPNISLTFFFLRSHKIKETCIICSSSGSFNTELSSPANFLRNLWEQELSLQCNVYFVQSEINHGQVLYIKCNKSIVCNAMSTLHKVSLSQNCTPILLLSKTNINFKFRASACIAWSCMKLSLFHNLKLLLYKVIKTSRQIQQPWSSWKSIREGIMNLKLLKNLFLYMFL